MKDITRTDITRDSVVVVKNTIFQPKDLLKVLFGMPVESHRLRQLYIFERCSSQKSPNKPLPSGILSQGSDPGLRCW